MSRQVLFALTIEILLISITVFLLLQPRFLFQKQSSTVRSLAKSLGGVFLCFTFFWSMIMGCILELNSVRFHF